MLQVRARGVRKAEDAGAKKDELRGDEIQRQRQKVRVRRRERRTDRHTEREKERQTKTQRQ